jgi:hypothetical protein
MSYSRPHSAASVAGDGAPLIGNRDATRGAARWECGDEPGVTGHSAASTPPWFQPERPQRTT